MRIKQITNNFVQDLELDRWFYFYRYTTTISLSDFI